MPNHIIDGRLVRAARIKTFGPGQRGLFKLAKQTELNPGSIVRIETTWVMRCKDKTTLTLAKALGVPPESLLRRWPS